MTRIKKFGMNFLFWTPLMVFLGVLICTVVCMRANFTPEEISWCDYYLYDAEKPYCIEPAALPLDNYSRVVEWSRFWIIVGPIISTLAWVPLFRMPKELQDQFFNVQASKSNDNGNNADIVSNVVDSNQGVNAE